MRYIISTMILFGVILIAVALAVGGYALFVGAVCPCIQGDTHAINNTSHYGYASYSHSFKPRTFTM